MQHNFTPTRQSLRLLLKTRYSIYPRQRVEIWCVYRIESGTSHVCNTLRVFYHGVLLQWGTWLSYLFCLPWGCRRILGFVLAIVRCLNCPQGPCYLYSIFLLPRVPGQVQQLKKGPSSSEVASFKLFTLIFCPTFDLVPCWVCSWNPVAAYK